MTFDEWIETANGSRCNDVSTLSGQPFLRNRLWWAFNAGQESKQQLQHAKNHIEHLHSVISSLKREIKKQNRSMNKLNLPE